MLKNPEGKKYTEYQYSEKFQGISVFQGKRELLKNPESKKYIPYSEHFQCKRKLFKTPECKNILNTVKNSRATLFSGQAQVVKNPGCEKYIHYSENFQGNCFFQRKLKFLKNREL